MKWLIIAYLNKRKIVCAEKKIIDENVVSSKNLFDLKIFENWKNQIENQFVNENSHWFSSNLTIFKFSNFARAEWRDFNDNQKTTAQQNFEIVLWFVSQFLIFSQKEKDRKISICSCCFENESNYHSWRQFFFSVDDFSEQFVDCMMIFFVNLFFDYDQIFLIETFRNLTAFQIFVDLMRMTIFSQKTINSVTQFVKIITRILMNHISRIALLFLMM